MRFAAASECTNRCHVVASGMNAMLLAQFTCASSVRGDTCGWIDTPAAWSSAARSRMRIPRCGRWSSKITAFHVLVIPRGAGEPGDVLDLVLGRRAVEVGDELDEPAVIAEHVEQVAELVVVGEA